MLPSEESTSPDEHVLLIVRAQTKSVATPVAQQHNSKSTLASSLFSRFILLTFVFLNKMTLGRVISFDRLVLKTVVFCLFSSQGVGAFTEDGGPNAGQWLL